MPRMIHALPLLVELTSTMQTWRAFYRKSLVFSPIWPFFTSIPTGFVASYLSALTSSSSSLSLTSATIGLWVLFPRWCSLFRACIILMYASMSSRVSSQVISSARIWMLSLLTTTVLSMVSLSTSAAHQSLWWSLPITSFRAASLPALATWVQISMRSSSSTIS